MMVGECPFGFQCVFDFFLYGLNLARGFGRANYEEVGKTVFAPGIKQNNVTCQLFTGGTHCLAGDVY
jgi:hypothetical protein